jgi:hypothetical protein
LTEPTSPRSVLFASLVGVQLVGLVFLPAIAGGALLLGGVALTPLAWLPVIGLLSVVAREQAGRSSASAMEGRAAQLSAAVVALGGALRRRGLLDTSWDGQRITCARFWRSPMVGTRCGSPLRHFWSTFSRSRPG